MENFGRRLLTLIVCFTMVLGSLNLQVFAYEDEKNSNSLSFVCEEYTEPAIGVSIPEQLKISSDDEKINLNDADVTVQWLKKIETGWMVTEESDFTVGEYRLSVNVVGLKVDSENEQIEKQTITVNGEEFEYISEDDWSFIDGKASFTVYSKIYKVVSDSVDAEDEIELESVSVVAEQVMPLADAVASDKIYYEIVEENGEKVLHLSSTPYDVEKIYISTNNSKDTPSSAEKKTCTKIVIDDEIFAPANCDSFFGVGFNNVTEIVNLNNLNTSKTTFMEFMFLNMEKVTSLDLSGFDFSNVTSTRYMFSNCKALKNITGLENKDAKKLENMERMFTNCSSLVSIDLSSFQTEALTNMQGVFSTCSKLTNVKLGGDFDTSNVSDMSYLFQNCTSLTDVNTEDLNTESVEDMALMFYGCGKLEKLDVSKFDTSNVKNFASMFYGCVRLKSIDTSKFDTKKATKMSSMFYNCKSLASVDVSSFETGNVTNMASMFYGCSSMVELDVSNFDTSNVTNMYRMFGVYNGAMKLQQLDLSNFDTSKVTNMSEMFLCSTSLQYLDISNFTINDGTNVANFFYKCDNLSKIESPSTVGENIVINLPTVMVNEDDRSQLFSILPKEPDYSESITLITYETSILTEGSESTLLFKKYLDDELINEAGKFEFGVFAEDGTDTGIRVSHDALGNILVETKDLPLGRYYVQEIVGKESVVYDNVKYYFTIEEETVSTNIVYPSSEVVYLPIDEDYLNTDKYDLVANGFTVTAYEKGTQNPVKTMAAYCANKPRGATYGPIGTTSNSVYINPTEAQIKNARGVDYVGPHNGELPDAIKCLLFFGDKVTMQDDLWDLLHYGKEVDTSKVNEIPASFKWAIIKSPNNKMQSLIVPLWTTEDKEVFDTIEGDSITRRTVKLETTDIEFHNETKPVATLQIPFTKTVNANGLTPGQQNFEFDVVPYGNPDLDISGLTITGTTVTTNGNGDYTFTIEISGDKEVIEAAGGFKITEKNTAANGWIYDETVCVVKTETDADGNLTYKLYKLTEGAAESVTDDKTYAANHYRPQGSGNNHCLTIDEKVAYCFNLERDWPWVDETPAVNEGYKKLENVSNADMQKYSAGALKDDVLRVIYNGYPYDNAGLKAKYNLNDDQFRAVTQVALWYYTEGAYNNVDDSMTDQQRWNNTFMIINRGVGAYGIQGEGNFWEGADDVTKANMYKCMADLAGATVKYSQGTGFNASSVFYRGNTDSLQQPAGNLTVDLFVHPTDDANIDEEEKIQNLLSIGMINPAGTTSSGLEEVEEAVFENDFEGVRGNLVITKTIEGDITEEEAEGAITFTVTDPNGNKTVYSLKDFKNEEGKYTLELNNVLVGQYTIEETTYAIAGKAVTVTYKVDSNDVNDGDSTAAVVAEGKTTKVEFNDDYADQFNIIIEKINVAGELLPGAILELYDANGNKVFSTEDIVGTANDTGAYSVADLVAGTYTLKEVKAPNGYEIAADIVFELDDKGVCTLISGQPGEANGDTITMQDEESAKPGNLVITKFIEGDITAEQVIKTIVFKVTAPDGTVTEYPLERFEEKDGAYVLELNGIEKGEYTVEETITDIAGKNVTVSYKLNNSETREGKVLQAIVEDENTSEVDFINGYEDKKGKLVISKTIEGDVTEEEAEGAITFTVTGPDGTSTTYTLDKFTKGEDGKYTLTLEDVVIGEYTVEETTKDVDGKNVTVTYTINSGDETEGDSAKAGVTEGNTTTVDFNNSYENKKGKLVITKTIEGDVTEEEAEGAITFKVTGPNDFEETYTLNDFENEDGKYTLTLEDVVIGEYTVEETTKDVDGKNVTVTYTINSGDETEGDSANAEVTEGNTTTVDFNNSYENKKGKLVITKTIEGDVTEEEAEGAITFKVTGPNDFEETYTLKDFDNEDGKYTLTLEDIVIGEYTVEETTKDVDGKNVTVTYKINSGTETSGDKATAAVTEGNTTTVDFNNSYENKKGKFVITKTIEGDVTEEEAEGAITFKVTGPDGTSTTYTLDKFTKGEDGKYTLTLEDVVIGEYTVEETTKDVDGKNVTVTYTINSGDETEGDSAKAEVTEGNTTTVDFNNSYENKKGKLVITKTIEGDVTEEEAEGAITFKVTGPDGTSTTYTLDKFTKGEDGKYTLTLEDVVIGEYTVEETTKDVDGKNVTVTYKINSGKETSGDKATAAVTEGNTTTVDFNNSYENKKGKLVITKTIEGDVTEEEAEGAITFKVTGPDGKSTTYTLDKFTKGEDGKYTLTLEDVVIGEYTVEETTKDVDGKNVTVTYTINSGDETEGDSAKAGVTEGNTTTVDFNNSYENKKGKLVITKTIEGDVTEEEAEGAITFKVTGPDGKSTTYTLDKFTKGEDGKYTLTLEDVVIGEYTVEETTKDVDGKNVTVTYKINSGTETSGDKATAEVTEGETTTVEFNNSYENEKPEIPNTGDHLVFSVASSLMFMSLSLLIAVIYAYKKFLNI